MYYSISQLVKEFVEGKSEKIDIGSDGMYKPKIEIFQSYLLDELKLCDDYKGIEAIKALDIEHIFKSMEYFIQQRKANPNKQYHVERVTTLDSYYVVISEFFRFLQDKHIESKKILLMISKLNYNIYLRNVEIDKVAIKYKLIEKVGMEPYLEGEIEKLIQSCNATIEEVDCDNVFKGIKHTNYKQFTSAIIAKLILYTGIKYKVVERIMYNHINTSESCIILNNRYTIYLPIDFSKQLEKYKEIRKLITSDTEHLPFFVKSHNSASPYNHLFIADYLNSRINKLDTTGLSKYTLVKLMNCGIPLIILKDMTSFEDSVLEDCSRYKNKAEDYKCLNVIVNSALDSIYHTKPQLEKCNRL